VSSYVFTSAMEVIVSTSAIEDIGSRSATEVIVAPVSVKPVVSLSRLPGYYEVIVFCSPVKFDPHRTAQVVSVQPDLLQIAEGD